MLIRTIVIGLTLMLLSTVLMLSQPAIESFSYPATIAGLGTAANGFGGSWLIDTSAHGSEGKSVMATNVFPYGDLSYAVPYSGNHVQTTLVNAWGDAQRYQRALASTWPNTAGNHYWVSYLLDVKTVPENDTYFMVKLYSADTLLNGKGELVAIGKQGGQKVPTFSCGSGAGTNWGGSGSDTSAVPVNVGPYWLVVRIDMSGDTICRTFMWVNPDPSTEPDTNVADVKRNSNMPDGFNAIGLEAGGNVGATPIQLVFDEIRLATNYTDLSSGTPSGTVAIESFSYPATIAGLGTAANGFGGSWLIDTSAHGSEGKSVMATNVFPYGDLSYAVPYSGNHVQTTLVNAWGDAQRYQRALASTWPNTAGNHYWVSYLLDVKTVPENDTYFMVKLYSADTLLNGKGELVAIGKQGGQKVPTFSCGSGAGTNWGGSGSDTSAVPVNVGPYWLVVRIDMSGDTICRTFMWVNPDPSTEPDTNVADVKRNSNMPDGFNAIGLEAGGNVGATPIQLVFDEIRLATNYTDLSSTTSVGQRIYNNPKTFSLSENYPNPFNPTTQINYTVTQSGHVSLKVYNLIGQQVATLFNGVRSAGAYQATFNASNMPSGIYFARLQSGTNTITKKMMLLK